MAEAPKKLAHLRVGGGPEGWKCKVDLDGVDISHHTSAVSIKAEVGAIVEAQLTVLASVEFDGIAEVEIYSKYAEALRRIDELEAKHRIPTGASPELVTVLRRLGWR